MKKSRIIVITLMMLVFTTFLVQAEDVKITFLNSKGEIQEVLEETAKYYSQITPGVEMEVIPAPVGQSPYEKLVSLYAAGNAPTIAMLDSDDLIRFKDRALDLSSEKWVKDAFGWSMTNATLDDGRIIGFPFAVEGFGLLYNKAAIEEAISRSFDPSAIKSRADLEDLFAEIKAGGKDPVVISPLDWSLGAHFTTVAYIAQSPDFAEVQEFLNDLKAGNVDLYNNKGLNGMLDTFDLMKKYNIDKNDPLAGTYDRGAELVGKGEVAFWFMGNWVWPQIADFAGGNTEFGYLPVFISEDPSDYGNSQIAADLTKMCLVDKDQSTPAEREAAKDFLNWLVYNSEGQNAWVKNANIVTPFKNIKIVPDDPLAASLVEYMNKGKTMRYILNLPTDNNAEIGGLMQKYLGNYVDREEYIKEFTEYWESK